MQLAVRSRAKIAFLSSGWSSGSLQRPAQQREVDQQQQPLLHQRRGRHRRHFEVAQRGPQVRALI